MKKKPAKSPQSNDTTTPGVMNPRVVANIHLAHLLERYGPALGQKDALVDDILAAFQSPGQWPLTDTERIAYLRKWYLMAQRVRETERAFMKAKGTT